MLRFSDGVTMGLGEREKLKMSAKIWAQPAEQCRRPLVPHCLVLQAPGAVDPVPPLQEPGTGESGQEPSREQRQGTFHIPVVC